MSDKLSTLQQAILDILKEFPGRHTLEFIKSQLVNKGMYEHVQYDHGKTLLAVRTLKLKGYVEYYRVKRCKTWVEVRNG